MVRVHRARIPTDQSSHLVSNASAPRADFTEDLRRFDVPTLIIHGDDDQIVPIGAAGLASSQLVKDATLKVYEGAPHGVADTHKDQLNADLRDFLRQ
ncbi:alpha/beta hydrolase [Pseudonocardia sp.]|uniref:alpha/beta fold hydrolase n=1 Tax=Pseudonocardia sp. TaxID=60912 RepID=UPI0031FE0B25